MGGVMDKPKPFTRKFTLLWVQTKRPHRVINNKIIIHGVQVWYETLNEWYGNIYDNIMRYFEDDDSMQVFHSQKNCCKIRWVGGKKVVLEVHSIATRLVGW